MMILLLLFQRTAVVIVSMTFSMTLQERAPETKSCFIPGKLYVLTKRSPDTSKIKPKMLYASSKDALRKKLDGIYTEIQCTDLSEVSYETVLDKVTRMTS